MPQVRQKDLEKQEDLNDARRKESMYKRWAARDLIIICLTVLLMGPLQLLRESVKQRFFFMIRKVIGHAM